MPIDLKKLDEMVKLAAGRVRQKVRTSGTRREASDDDDDIGVGVSGILAATEKLLAVNRELVPPDDRSSLQFKKILSTENLMRERIRLDANKTRLGHLRQAARSRSLQRTHPFLFDNYTEGHLIGNPLSSPLEEINPIQLLESSRRITQMGPGGVGSSEALTDEDRAVHPSQFGFICPISGPESEKIGIDTRAATGVKLGSDGKLYQRFLNKRTNRYSWLSPDMATNKVIGLPD